MYLFLNSWFLGIMSIFNYNGDGFINDVFQNKLWYTYECYQMKKKVLQNYEQLKCNMNLSIFKES